MRKKILLVIVYMLAGLMGVVGALALLKRNATLGDGAGVWRVSLLAGSADADMVTRARVALGGLLALNRSETMYYVASKDSTGQPLRAACRYRVHGLAPPARWWSITAYADDLFLFPNPEQRYSFNSLNAASQDRFEFSTGPAAPPTSADHWIPTPGTGGLILTLRVYNPSAQLQAQPQSLQAPSIERMGACAQAAS